MRKQGRRYRSASSGLRGRAIVVLDDPDTLGDRMAWFDTQFTRVGGVRRCGRLHLDIGLEQIVRRAVEDVTERSEGPRRNALGLTGNQAVDLCVGQVDAPRAQ